MFKSKLTRLSIVILIILNLGCTRDSNPGTTTGLGQDTEACAVRLISTVGPFSPGSAEIPFLSYGQIKQLVDSIAIPGKYSEILIFSGIDKRELRGMAGKTFGENLNLAQARGAIVKNVIVGIENAKKIPTFIFPQGANYTGQDSSKYAEDRCVHIWGRKK